MKLSEIPDFIQDLLALAVGYFIAWMLRPSIEKWAREKKEEEERTKGMYQ